MLVTLATGCGPEDEGPTEGVDDESEVVLGEKEQAHYVEPAPVLPGTPTKSYPRAAKGAIWQLTEDRSADEPSLNLNGYRYNSAGKQTQFNVDGNANGQCTSFDMKERYYYNTTTGKLERSTLGNGAVVITRYYNATTGRLERLTTDETARAGIEATLRITYNSAGKVSKEEERKGTGATEPIIFTTTHSYDASGRRTRRKTVVPPTPGAISLRPPRTETWTFDCCRGNKPVRYTLDESNYGFIDQEYTYQYNSACQKTRVDSVGEDEFETYTYDSLGRLASVTNNNEDSATTTRYTYLGTTRLVRVTDTGSLRQVFDYDTANGNRLTRWRTGTRSTTSSTGLAEVFFKERYYYTSTCPVP